MTDNKTLTQRLEEGDYPNCPVYNLMDQGLLYFKAFKTSDGVVSNYCPECPRFDITCDLFIEYIECMLSEETL